jgi:hypothetical protein
MSWEIKSSPCLSWGVLNPEPSCPLATDNIDIRPFHNYLLSCSFNIVAFVITHFALQTKVSTTTD